MNQTVYVQSGVPVGEEGVDQKPSLVKGIAGQNMTALPQGFTPGAHDVICGRGRKAFNHIGNENFRRLVESRLAEYSRSAAKLEKSYILSDIVCEVRQRSPTGGFVKKDSTSGQWYEVGDFLAREKTSQAFRDALHDQYKSSNTAKKMRRQAEQTEKHPDLSPHSSFSFEQPSNYGMGNEQTANYGMGKPPRMHQGRYEPSQDSLLGALDVEISASLTGKSPYAQNSGSFHGSAQNSATSVVDFSPAQRQQIQQQQQQQQQRQQQSAQPDWGNQSCPNFSWSPDVAGSHNTINPMHRNMNNSAPHMMFEMDSPPRSMHRAPVPWSSGSERMDDQPDESMGSESYGDDLILSPIGDGSPRKLFASLSKVDGPRFRPVGSYMNAAPMLE
jgi:hypothetical protein